ncbi:MAG TPA: O-antigen ligase family protein, partial [Vicinamibacteria bacterium]|nr:O-antigen ligase family protein [Vicinamibacteria bacterium]
YFLSSRSVVLGLAVGLFGLLLARRIRPGLLLRTVTAAAVTVLLLVQGAPLLGVQLVHWGTPELSAAKALSVEMRLALWRGTLTMIGDHPLGVGSGNFADAFIPYQLSLEPIATPKLIFRTPHDELLRLLAEEGLVFAALAAVLAVLVLRWACRLHPAPGLKSRLAHPLLIAEGAFLAVQACVQFPFATAYGCLMAAVLLGLVLARLEPGDVGSDEPARGWRWSGLTAGLLLVAASGWILGREVGSEMLFVNSRLDVTAEETACRLNPRNLPACTMAAWLHARAGDHARARILLREVLERSPYYHPAIRLSIEEAAARGEGDEACREYRAYQRLFRGRGEVVPMVKARCDSGAGGR